MKRYFSFSFLLIYLALQSCSFETKNNSIESLEDFVAEVEHKQDKYSEKDWYAAEDRFYEICEKRLSNYETEFTPGERKRINHLIGKYNTIKVKHDLKSIKNDLLDLSQQTKGFLDELADESKTVEE